jgi:hypothetical protein
MCWSLALGRMAQEDPLKIFIGGIHSDLQKWQLVEWLEAHNQPPIRDLFMVVGSIYWVFRRLSDRATLAICI